MPRSFFNPDTGEYYEFEPGEQPPANWKELKPVPLHPDWTIISRGGCILYEPGKEPKLFVDAETGEAKWFKGPFYPGGNWKPLTALDDAPPMAEKDGAYFNPATGETYVFKPGQTPPTGWVKLKPLPPHPDWNIISRGGCVLYEPGKEPKLFIDPETGEAKWFKGPFYPTEKWKPYTPLAVQPPMTENENSYFNPATGEAYVFHPGQTPPAGWGKSKPIPPHPDWDIISKGGCVFYEPGKEPKLFIDPETGEARWFKGPFYPAENWKPYSPLAIEPPLTEQENEQFNPGTGESYFFKPGQVAPQGWKKLGPVPPHPDHDIIAGGGCVLYEPGKEPKLFVNAETGECRWFKNFFEVPLGWTPLNPLLTEPAGTLNESEFFDPATGQSYHFEPGTEPPQNWKPLRPIPLHPDHDIIAGGGCVLYEPGKEPKLFVDPETGESHWFKNLFEVPAGWVPLTALPAPPDRLNRSLNTGAEFLADIPGEENDVLKDMLRFFARTGAAAHPIAEWSIWNPVRNFFNISKWNPALDISPLHYHYHYSYKQTWSQNLSKLAKLRYSLQSLQGRINGIFGLAFESVAGGNLLKNYPAMDMVKGGKLTQVKALYVTTAENVAKVAEKAAAKFMTLFTTGINPRVAGKYFFSSHLLGSAIKMHYVVPTGTSASAIRTIIDETRKIFLTPKFAQLGVQSEAIVTSGMPGKIGSVLKGLGIVGGLLSAYQLTEDIKKGDFASGVGSAAGTATLVLETGAAVFGTTAMATASALTGSFAAGYAAGTLINEYVLPEESKSLIGETLHEFEKMSWKDIWDFYTGD